MIPSAFDEAEEFETFEEGRERPAIEVEAVAEFADGHGLFGFPQHDQDEILRVREPEFGEQRTVEPHECPAGVVQREAQVLVELGRSGTSHIATIARHSLTTTLCTI